MCVKYLVLQGENVITKIFCENTSLFTKITMFLPKITEWGRSSMVEHSPYVGYASWCRMS
jgi:hypothetical protein